MVELVHDHALEAYERFAAFYDDYSSHHNYDAKTAVLERLAVDSGVSGRRLLDVACGTGKSFVPMLDRGWTVTACDVSPAMVERSAGKAAGRATVVTHDMRRLPQLGAFDLVWSLGDAVNYLHSHEELVATFEGVRRNLAPGGGFLFDVNTLCAYRTTIAALHVQASSEQVIVLDGHGSPDTQPGDFVDSWIERLAPADDGTWTRVRTVHHQRHHPVESLREALAEAGLTLRVVRGYRSGGRLGGDLDELQHTKAILIAFVTP
jgi:SAM-dependent methyltransferase